MLSSSLLPLDDSVDFDEPQNGQRYYQRRTPANNRTRAVSHRRSRRVSRERMHRVRQRNIRMQWLSVLQEVLRIEEQGRLSPSWVMLFLDDSADFVHSHAHAPVNRTHHARVILNQLLFIFSSSYNGDSVHSRIHLSSVHPSQLAGCQPGLDRSGQQRRLGGLIPSRACV